MNRIDRLTAILIQLQTRRVVPGREIAERFGICLRTVYRDIRALEDAGIPIGSEVGMGYFLAPQEARSLLIGAKLIEKFSDPSVNRHYACALDKIKAVMGKTEGEDLNSLSAYIEVLKTAPRHQQGFANDLLLDIQSVLGRNQVIHIGYTSGYKNETTNRAVEPLGLCFYAGNWHLLAFCRLRRDYRDFRVDRIKSVQSTASIFDPSRHDDLPRLISKIVYESDVVPARVRFDRRVIQFVGEQKYYFGFVDEKIVGGQVEMNFLTSSYDYMSHWLLGYVDAVEVVSPPSLKQTLADYAERLYRHYHQTAD
jgi:predicted DNA-binding transcriptional regulator YafY